MIIPRGYVLAELDYPLTLQSHPNPRAIVPNKPPALEYQRVKGPRATLQTSFGFDRHSKPIVRVCTSYFIGASV